jgi:hypothetical protein
MKNDTAVSLLVASLVIALVCVPVMAANVTYPQEYYTLSERSSMLTIISDVPEWDEEWATPATTKYTMIAALELRRQTILMEKQNELLAEQNELMGRLVNATEIKFVVYPNPVYATQATSWNLDEPDASPSFNVSNYEYTPNEVDKISCDSLSRFQGCS